MAADLPITGTQAIKYKDTIPLCHPNQFIVCPRSNNADYTVVDVNTPAGNNPRNNVPQSGPVGITDADGDGIDDASDNCSSMANPDQAEFDGDAIGDACDPDIDGDGIANGSDSEADADLIPNTAETTCGSDPNDSLLRPERIDGAFAGADDDGDLAVDEALPPGAAAFDCDGDGYKGGPESGTPLCGSGVNEDNLDDAVVDDGCPGGPLQAGAFSEAQFNIGGNDQDPCGLIAWPSDFVSGGIFFSTNQVDIADLGTFLAPARRLDTQPGDLNFNARWDLQPGAGLFGPA